MNKETKPFWLDVKLPTYSPLKENLQCDVCVIGAGIAGLTTAFLLSESGKKVVVVDDGPVAGGQTMRTTGHLTSVLREKYCKLEKYFGPQGAKIAAKSHQAAIEFIQSLVAKHQIDCDWETTKAYLCFAPKDVIQKEFAAAKRMGLSVTMLKRAPIKSFNFGPAIRFSKQARFHPLKYISKLCELILAEGGSIYGHTHVSSIEKEQNYTLTTKDGQQIQADHVVVATNSPISSRFFPHLKQAAYRTYAIAGKVPASYVPAGLFYDTLDPYHYIRTHKNQNGEDILIIGGEDHRTAEKKDIEENYLKLESWARERFPLLEEIAYRWSGQVTESIDGLGFIGRADKKELYIITGDSGNGLTHGTIGALLINALIHGISSPFEKLYDPNRKTLKAAGTFIEENLNTALQYADWFTGGDHTELAPNSGAVVRDGLKKCAHYRDNTGKIHKMSAVCPHLGAIVRWNDAEKCFECPAHGSRFSAIGEVIQGPANQDLKKL